MDIIQALSNAQELAKLRNAQYVVVKDGSHYFPSDATYHSQHHYHLPVALEVMPNGDYKTSS